MPESPRWLIDTDQDDLGMRVIADLHGGDPNHPEAQAEFKEIRDRVQLEVRFIMTGPIKSGLSIAFQRDSGEARSYAVMWRKYQKRVLLAMSSQAFAQLVSFI